MKFKIALFVSLLWSGFATAQVQQVLYGNRPLGVPAGYTVVGDRQVESPSFTAQWYNMSHVMFDKNVHRQFIRQEEQRLHAKFLSGVQFTSQGAAFTGRLYKLPVKEGIQFQVLAYGTVNDQPLVLSLGFEKEPKSDSAFDAFVRNFFAVSRQ